MRIYLGSPSSFEYVGPGGTVPAHRPLTVILQKMPDYIFKLRVPIPLPARNPLPGASLSGIPLLAGMDYFFGVCPEWR